MKNRTTIAGLVVRALNSSPLNLDKSTEEILQLIELPKDSNLGDWAFPCFVLSKQLRRPPPVLAQELAQIIQSYLATTPEISSVRPTGPYLNFFVNKSALAGQVIPDILAGGFLKRRQATGERVMIEYSQPNTHKAFHVGHVRCAALGDILIRINEWLGADVVAANYIGDEGTHVAKCLWYYTEVYKGEVPKTNLGEFLGDLYVKATDALDLSTLTRAPYPGVIAVKVLDISKHPNEPKWNVLQLDTGSGQKQVVSAILGFKVGDVIPFALPGTEVSDKTVGSLDKKGVFSEGMVCSEHELGLSEIRESVTPLPANTPLGTQIAEIFRIENAVPAGQSVLAEIAKRTTAVSNVLQRMEAKEPEMYRIWKETKQWSMDELRGCYAWLDCRFDHYFFESEFGEAGKEIVREFKSKGIFVESQGAVGADLSQFKLGFIILIKRDGTATYATRDLALARKKFEEFKVDRAIYVVDSAQTLHFQQVFKCLELMQFPQASKCYHLSYAQVVRPDGKMSSRKGNVVLFSQLKERLLSKINQEFLSKYQGEWSAEEVATTGHRIALATMRYGMMNQDNVSQVVFDLDEWTARSGNTGPYLLYACARIYSILREAGEVDCQGANWACLKDETEVALVAHLNRYHEVLSHVAQNYSPHLLCSYLYELSKKFSSMYKVCSVLKAESTELRQVRVCLVKAVVDVLSHGLGLLGIQTVERM